MASVPVNVAWPRSQTAANVCAPLLPQVIGYNERGRVRVRFPKGTWNFLATELRKESDRGLTAAALAYLEHVANDLLGNHMHKQPEE